MALVLLALNVLTVPTMAETENGDETAIGYLSYLNMSEELYRHATEKESRRTCCK